jgi:ABC-type uncharacterized transport system substrate-binding protein
VLQNIVRGDLAHNCGSGMPVVIGRRRCWRVRADLSNPIPMHPRAAVANVSAVYNQSAFARDGGLLSYGPDLVDIWRRAASYADRILRGAKPAELPVQLPTKFEMVVNLKTAKALGLTVPQSILVRADEVIE